ncbi:MAG: ABC transporter permease [Thermoleophilia bacterium]|nr:ABC transporter permease [Thermoleophilia bacterium]
MIDLVAAELLKLRSTRTALGLLIAAVLVGLAPAVLILIFAPAEVLEDETVGGFGFLVTGVTVVPLLGLVFGILSMTNEYRHGTITYSYLVTPRRARVIAVKLFVCFGVGIVVLALVGSLVTLTAIIGYEVRSLELETSFLFEDGVAETLALVLLAAGLMAALGVGLGALFRNQPATVAGTLIWALAGENIVVSLKPAVGQYLPFAALQQVVTGGVTVSTGAEVGLSRPEAFLVSLGYIAVVSIAAVYTTMRRDVT